MTSVKNLQVTSDAMPHTVLKTSAVAEFHNLKPVSIFRWRVGNQRCILLADSSSVFFASGKSSSAPRVTEVNAIVPHIVQIPLVHAPQKAASYRYQ